MLDKVENTAADDEAEAEHDDAPEFNPKLETLCGDLRDVMLGRIRTTRKPWEQMTEAEQTDLANGLQLAASDMVRRMVRLMTSYDWPHAPVDIKKDQAELELADGEGVPDPAEAELPLEDAGQEIDPATPSEG